MRITKQEVKHVGVLARLDIEEDVVDKFAEQIGNILEYIETLNQVDTEGVIPTSHDISVKNIFREDAVKEHFTVDKVIKNAPDSEDGFFLVPKIIG